MLRSIKINNFKCIENIELNDIKELTIFTGSNNSGKSSVFQALVFIRNCLNDNQVNWESRLLHLKNFQETVYKHDRKNNIQISCNFDIEYEIFGKAQKAIQFNSEIHNGKFISQQALTSENIPIITWTNKYFTVHRSNFDAGDDLKIQYIAESPLVPILCEVKELDDDEDLISTIIKDEFKNMYYLSPNRGINEWEYTLGNEPVIISSLGDNAASVMHYQLSERDFRFEKLESWLKAFDDNIILVKSPIRPGNKVSLKFDTKNSKDVHLLYTGTGLNKVISVAMLSIFSPENSTILIEEPEMHLHTKAINMLMDLFLEETHSNNKQIIFTTHSWDIHLYLWKRIHEKKITQEKIARFDFSNENGKTSVENEDLEKTFINYRDNLKNLLG